MTKDHGLGGFNNRNLFLIILKAGSPRSRSWPVEFLVRILLLARDLLPAVSSHGEGERERERY